MRRRAKNMDKKYIDVRRLGAFALAEKARDCKAEGYGHPKYITTYEYYI